MSTRRSCLRPGNQLANQSPNPMLTLTPSTALSPGPGWSEQNFERRYARALACLRSCGCRVEVGPVESQVPNEHLYPRLAFHLKQAALPWRWVSVSHASVGLLGQLALCYEGTVRNEWGRELSDLTLMQWGTREMNRATRRITHQSRLNTALNEQLLAGVRRELSFVRTACLVAGLAAVFALGVAHALTVGWLHAEGDLLLGVLLTLAGAGGMSSWVLGVRWWQLTRWQRQDKGR